MAVKVCGPIRSDSGLRSGDAAPLDHINKFANHRPQTIGKSRFLYGLCPMDCRYAFGLYDAYAVERQRKSFRLS